MYAGNDDEFKILATSFKLAPLKDFYVQITEIDSVELLIYFETFLKDHKTTWTKLNLTVSCVDEWMNRLNFPEIVNLTDLSIHEWCIDEKELDEGQAPFEIVNFGELFPKLITLFNLYEYPKSEGRRFFNLDELFPEHTTPVLSLKHLSLPPQFDPFILRRIGCTFPNVSKLTLTVRTPEVLNELWVTWPEITLLDIRIIADM